MFNTTKYTKWYQSIIDNAVKRTVIEGYVEKHHIIPKSLGGDDSPDNLVLLTAKEHFIAHHLLTKMCVGDKDQNKMWSAFFFMPVNPSSKNKRDYYCRTYEISKNKMAEGKKKFFSGKNNPFYGRKATEEHKEKMRQSWNRSAPRNMDKTIYTFVHDEFGTEVCTRKELCEKYGVSQKRIYTIVNKLSNTAKGWKILWVNEAIL